MFNRFLVSLFAYDYYVWWTEPRSCTL